MTQVFTGIGSNVNRDSNITGGVKALEAEFGELLISSVYETIPYGFDGDNFYNLVVGFRTNEDVGNVTAKLRVIEYEFGRSRKQERFSSRTLDIDLLLYGDLVQDEENLRIPREDILNYSFVLCPLAEIAPDLDHPVENKSYQQLWQEFDKPRDNLWKIEMHLDFKE